MLEHSRAVGTVELSSAETIQLEPFPNLNPCWIGLESVVSRRASWRNAPRLHRGPRIPAYEKFFLRNSMALTSAATASITSTTGSTLNSKTAKKLVKKWMSVGLSVSTTM